MTSSDSTFAKKRDVKFDGLRVIGLLAIILAHVNPPALLFQLRNFDVPLMVLVSGAVYGLSSSKKKYVSYIWGRVLRLLTPTWVFLIIFFLINFIIGHHFSRQDMLSSFLLLNGIGYVWIIRVFILVAVIAPFFVYLYQKIQNKLWYLCVVGFICICYVGLYQIYRQFPVHANALVDFIFQNIIFYMLPFGCVAGLGIYMLRASKKSLIRLFVLFATFFIFLSYTHQFVPTQNDKYPPGMYYLSYALGISLLLYLLSFTTVFQKVFGSRLMQFISASSLWIYLWQIFFLYQWGYLKSFMPQWFDTFFVEYVVIVVISTLVVYGQKRLIKGVVEKVQNKTIQNVLSTSFLK